MEVPREDCIFCQIISGKTPADIVMSGERCIVFRDINPQAPTHLLIVPRRHFVTLGELAEEDPAALSEMMRYAHMIAASYKYDKRGYRIVFNEGPDAGRTVEHVHFHFLAGRPLSWPPG